MKRLVVALAGLAVFAPGALAANHFLKVSPTKLAAGKTITISGSVAGGCRTGHKGDSATIYSRAFKGAKHTFAGVPALSASLSSSKHGTFSIKFTLSKGLKAASYTVSGRCGGGNFGSAKLQVTKPGSTGSGYGFY